MQGKSTSTLAAIFFDAEFSFCSTETRSSEAVPMYRIRAMPSAPLVLAPSPAEIQESIAAFNAGARTHADRAKKLLAETTYWVYDPSTEAFGPSKFVAFTGMDFDRYESARVESNGNVTRRSIERVLQTDYEPNKLRAAALRKWGKTLFGTDAFGTADPGKWVFVDLPVAAAVAKPTSKNPPWQRDELILALDLYLRLNRRVPDDSEPEVIALSEVLNGLPIHPIRPDVVRFRNPNGVALKLANFRALDQPGHGMKRGNRLEQVVWDEFADDPDRLRQVAEAIKAGYRSDLATASESSDTDVDETDFPEGRVIYRLHRARERNTKMIEKKKAQALAEHGRLACEACGFDFAVAYGPAGQGYIECHHTRALGDVAGPTTTKLADLMLVCANCHRIVHRKRPWLTRRRYERL